MPSETVRYTRQANNKLAPQNEQDELEYEKACVDNDKNEVNSISINELTPVAQMFAGKSVFITGASGFIGRVLLEKLLRSYPDIKNIYILMREKKNLHPLERLHKQLLNAPIFDKLKSLENSAELLNKLVVVGGDIGEQKLGISEQDYKMLTEDPTLSIVFHSAATVKFDEPLKKSVRYNLYATQAIIELCKQLKNLACLCHVSTAYVNSDLTNGEVIEEKLYSVKENPKDVIKMAELLDDDLLQIIRPKLLGNKPNTYTYTKSLGEHLIALEASELPVAIVRPSIVVASWCEPFQGWVDNINGPTGLLLAIGKGLLRTMHVRTDVKADIIPVDIVVNTMIAAGYYAAKTNNKLKLPVPCSTNSTDVDRHTGGPVELAANALENNQTFSTSSLATDPSNPVADKPANRCNQTIFHCVSGDSNPILWGNISDFFPIIKQYPSERVLRYPFGTFKGNKYHDLFTRWIVHFLPALLIDLLCWITGRKRQLVYVYQKLHSATASLSYFATTDFNFNSNNLRLLQTYLSDPRDKRELFMDIATLDWEQFWHHYTLGARRFVLKEQDQTLEMSRKNLQRAFYREMIFRTILVILASICCLPIIRRILPA